MVKQTTGRWHYLLSAGLLVMALSMILQRSLPDSLPLWDLTTGLCMGVGLGLMLLALIMAKKHQRSNC